MEAHMTRTDSRYERLDDIERKLARQPEGWTTGDLAREFGVDADTIRRDLLLIEGRGTGLIKQGRRYTLNHRRSSHSVLLNNDEALALYLAARLLSRHSDEHNPHVVKALEKLADALDAKSPLIAHHIAQAAAVRQRRMRREYVEALEVLTQGWAEGRKVRLRYRSYAKDETTERTFAYQALFKSHHFSAVKSFILRNSGLTIEQLSALKSLRPDILFSVGECYGRYFR
jgi:predicted DNA-binding transcriptional regulator YafY